MSSPCVIQTQYNNTAIWENPINTAYNNFHDDAKAEYNTPGMMMMMMTSPASTLYRRRLIFPNIALNEPLLVLNIYCSNPSLIFLSYRNCGILSTMFSNLNNTNQFETIRNSFHQSAMLNQQFTTSETIDITENQSAKQINNFKNDEHCSIFKRYNWQ